MTAPNPLPPAIMGGSRYELDPEYPEIFSRDGFVGPIEVYSEAVAARLADCADVLRVRAPQLEARLYEVEAGSLARPDEVVFHCLGGWLVEDLLRAAVFEPRVTVPAAQCLGVRRLRFWHDQIFTKPPRHPGLVPWHQDYSYWQRTTPEAHVTVHIALDDADEDNGCLHYVPGSHRWPLLERTAFDGPMDAVLEHLSPECLGAFHPRAMTLKRGQAVVHHGRTLHGSYANQSDRPRRALVLNYFADGVRAARDESMLRGLPVFTAGSPLVEPWFPLVLDRGPGSGPEVASR
ncbi:MAG: phytanoyl-CoA dioxygenase family protein [Planctomycetes bacterium]|nr:phytanoyl-CoA dioxygenase family protein [Planctomycetota bacterium]MCB9917812.1 phytanoyl-CoA dioxygenase family protein [Planctomycetota bacterium]